MKGKGDAEREAEKNVELNKNQLKKEKKALCLKSIFRAPKHMGIP